MEQLYVYSYNNEINEYIGMEIAQEDPLFPGTFLDPAKSTRIAPPDTKEQEVAIFEDSGWVIKPDYRNEIQVNIATKETSVVDYVGKIKEGFQIITREMAEDLVINPDNYGVIDGIFQDITNTIQWREQNAKKVLAELLQYNYELKAEKAYGGVILVQDGVEYVFETKETSISSVTAATSLLQDDQTVAWKFYSNNLPTYIPLTRAQLKILAQFGLDMINNCFIVELTADEKLYKASVKELNDSKWVETFKTLVKEGMNAVNNRIDFNSLNI